MWLAARGYRVLRFWNNQVYIDADITARLIQTAEEAAQSGVQVDVREYMAA